ncbi:helix-turn-helix domain-containing protein [Levyella massiliensis]|uniref:helix-turn-helix domain-containing protein n=1 Tax=Levyella massiliensis TaxID=938289 RepID=UPI003EB7CFEA
MKGLVSKKMERLLDLITCFEVHDGELDINTAAEALDCPTTTLLMDILQANTTFSTIFQIKRDNKIRLVYKNGNSYSDVFSMVMKQDPICSLLEKVFFHSDLDVAAMTNDLYVSPSTIYRWVEQFNSAVSGSYAVHLETHPLVLTGEEAEVRSFYTSFFKERYSLYEWPFPAVSKKELSRFLNETLPMEYGKKFLHYYECFHIQLAVTLQRFSQGFRLPDENLMQNTRAQQMAKAINAKGIRSSFSFFPVEKEDDDVRFCQELLAPFVSDRDAESFEVLLDLTTRDPLANNLFLYINKLIAYLCQEFPVELDNESALILALYNALMGTFGKTVSRSFLYSPYRIYQESIRVKFPGVCNQILRIIRAQNELFDLSVDPDFLGYLFYVIWSTWENLSNQLIQKPRKIKVLVISKFSSFHALSLRSQILFYFGNIAEVSIPKESPIFLDAIDLSRYDLLVSNFKIADSPIPTVFCNGIDSYAAYSALSKAISARL